MRDCAKLTYAIVGAGIDIDGWYKVRLLRSDGRLIKASKKRVAQLRREGRIVESAEPQAGGSFITKGEPK